MDDESIFAATEQHRLLAVDMFASLTPEQWTTPSLCAGWTVREVCAHMTPPDAGLLTVLGLLVRYRGDLHRMVDETARAAAAAPTSQLVADLRAAAARRFAPPGIGPVGQLVDSAVHLRDAARPLGLDVSPPLESWRAVLDFLASPRAARGFVAKGRLAGLRLVATDQAWSHGAGEEVRGASEALAMAAAGRRAVLDELEGPGVALLAAR